MPGKKKRPACRSLRQIYPHSHSDPMSDSDQPQQLPQGDLQVTPEPPSPIQQTLDRSPESQPQAPPPEVAQEATEAAQESGAPIEKEEEELPQLMDPLDDDVVTAGQIGLHPLPQPKTMLRRAKRKKAPMTSKERQAALQKLALLRGNNFRPVPFVPTLAVDLAKHEALFRALDLWDFAHLRLDRDLRPDLLMHLIAYYSPPQRRSFVHDLRINVNRAALARALKLNSSPIRKDKYGCSESGVPDPNQELYSLEQSATAIMDFVSCFMLFQSQDDACILPSEIMVVHQLVKEGQPHKVDWAGLMWIFVEKELLESPESGCCYFASHLQCLIKHQQPKLFGEQYEEPSLVLVPEADTSTDVAMAEEEEDAEDACEDVPVRIRSLDDFSCMTAENHGHGPGLSLGLGGDLAIMDGTVADDVVRREEEDQHWLPEDKNGGVTNCLRRCNSSIPGSMEFENLCKEYGEGREEERFDDDVSARFPSLDGLTSTGLLQAMDTMHEPYNQQINSIELSSGGLLAMKADNQKTIPLDHVQGGPFFFGNNGKRSIVEMDDDEDDDNVHQFSSQCNQQKRMRSSAMWEQAPSDFGALMAQMDSSMQKATMLFEQKEQQCMSSQMQVHYLNQMIEEKDKIIQSMERARMEEQQKLQMDVCRYEHEINVMANLVNGYKKALRKTRASFAEYRNKFPQGDEPLYGDAAGSSGLVLTVKELERQRLEKMMEMRHKAEEICIDFVKSWADKMDVYASRVNLLSCKLTEIVDEFKLLKERFQNLKTSDS